MIDLCSDAKRTGRGVAKNFLFHVFQLILYATKAHIHLEFSFCNKHKVHQTGDSITNHSLFLLPWQTKPFECAGRVAVNNLQCETKLMAGDTGGRCIGRIRQESFYQLQMLYDDQDRMTV